MPRTITVLLPEPLVANRGVDEVARWYLLERVYRWGTRGRDEVVAKNTVRLIDAMLRVPGVKVLVVKVTHEVDEENRDIKILDLKVVMRVRTDQPLPRQ